MFRVTAQCDCDGVSSATDSPLPSSYSREHLGNHLRWVLDRKLLAPLSNHDENIALLEHAILAGSPHGGWRLSQPGEAIWKIERPAASDWRSDRRRVDTQPPMASRSKLGTALRTRPKDQCS